MKNIVTNRKAHHDYFIEDKYEAGIELLGWEVKSARAGNVNLNDAFVFFEGKGGKDEAQAILKNSHFGPYSYGVVTEQLPRRDRRLLLGRAQINKLHTAAAAKGYTVTPTKIYLNNQGRVKVEIALARGKHTYDKKQTLKERDIAREAEKAIRQR